MLTEEQIDYYYDHPVEYFEDILKVQPDKLQQRVLKSISNATKNKKNISVKSGH